MLHNMVTCKGEGWWLGSLGFNGEGSPREDFFVVLEALCFGMIVHRVRQESFELWRAPLIHSIAPYGQRRECASRGGTMYHLWESKVAC